MKMKTKTTLEAAETTAKPGDWAQLACARAKALEEAGEFEAAREAIAHFWERIGERPRLEGLDTASRAEVLLRAGTLSGWIGSARQIPGAQEIAKDLISEAGRMFEESDLEERVAETRIDLAICYWREGAIDEARVTLDEALNRLGNLPSEQRLRALLNRAIIEKVSDRHEDALKTLRQAAPLFETSDNNTLRGKFHNQFALTLKDLGLAENRADYLDQSLVEYAAAGFHLELAGNKRFHAMVENNVGYLFVFLGRFREAKTHLDRARSLFTALKDRGMVAQVDDTRARSLIAQGRFAKAEALARGSVQIREEGDELWLLAEALTTHGIALARLENFGRARSIFEKAIRTAHNAGNVESGGIAALSMVEELAGHLPFSELLVYYRMAESELANSARAEIRERLGRCARCLLASNSIPVSEYSGSTTTNGSGSQQAVEMAATAETTFAEASLDEQVLRYEGELIRQALEASGGSITRAARMLGITHQGLAFILNGRHKNLLAARKPAKPRRRSIIRHN